MKHEKETRRKRWYPEGYRKSEKPGTAIRLYSVDRAKSNSEESMIAKSLQETILDVAGYREPKRRIQKRMEGMGMVVYERLRDRLEAALPDSQEHAESTEELADRLGVQPREMAKACRVLQRFGAAQCRKGPHVKNYQRRNLWWGSGRWSWTRHS
jgi:hypothetical protein